MFKNIFYQNYFQQNGHDIIFCGVIHMHLLMHFFQYYGLKFYNILPFLEKKMSDTNEDCKCCPGKQGEQGVPGAQGLQGIQGIPGQDGAQGIQGSQGLQGVQGIPGDCVNCKSECHCPEPEFAEVYSIITQDLAASPGVNMPGQVVTLENTIFATSNIDVTQAGTTGKIIVNRAGWYDVYTGLCGSLNPISSPLPVWTLSLFKNGAIVPGSTFANMTLSPEQKANEIVADVFVHCNIGDVLELANTSVSNVVLTAPSLGTNAQTNSAYLKLILLKAD